MSVVFQDVDFHFIQEEQALFVHGERLDLTPLELRLVAMFFAHPYKVFTYGYIADHIYGYVHATRHGLHGHINRLRTKLGPHADVEIIHIVRGVGYSLTKRTGLHDPMPFTLLCD